MGNVTRPNPTQGFRDDNHTARRLPLPVPNPSSSYSPREGAIKVRRHLDSREPQRAGRSHDGNRRAAGNASARGGTQPADGRDRGASGEAEERGQACVRLEFRPERGATAARFIGDEGGVRTLPPQWKEGAGGRQSGAVGVSPIPARVLFRARTERSCRPATYAPGGGDLHRER